MNKPARIVFIAALVLTTTQLWARLGETEAEIEARYGAPVSKEAYQRIDRTYNAQSALSAEERERNLSLERRDFPENFEEDGTRIDFVGEDALIHADGRLIFFNPETAKWDDLRSSVIGRKPTKQDSDVLKGLTANARKHLRQRFYILNSIGISVVYLGGRSVSEAYHQKLQIFPKEFADELIRKSYPDAVLESQEGSQGYPRLVKIFSNGSQELRGCATHLDGILTVSAYPYFNILKAMEDGLKTNAEIQQSKKLDGF